VVRAWTPSRTCKQSNSSAALAPAGSTPTSAGTEATGAPADSEDAAVDAERGVKGTDFCWRRAHTRAEPSEPVVRR
jgi:hypothetical protein